MTESSQEQPMNSSFNPELRKQYARVRPIVKIAENKARQSPKFKPQDIRSLRKGAFFAASEAEKTSMIDPVTGLYSRAWMERELDERIAAANRKGYRFRIMLIDYDHFKWINDGYGHSVGDGILGCIRSLSTRKEEPVARWGGEEFLQIIENQDDENDENGLAALTSRHMDTIGETTERALKHNIYKQEQDPTHKLDKVTLSIGIADYTPGMTKDQLLELADRALYQAKKTRNTAVYAKQAKDNNYEFVNLSRVNKQEQLQAA